MASSGRLARAAALAVPVWVLLVVSASAQSTARVRRAENVRREPNGQVLARMEPGASLSVVGREDRWLEVELEGWVWARSLQVADREGFDLIVSEAQGENLREAPSGSILGRLGRGTLLDEMERRPGWIRVRRQGWIWAPSVVETSSPAATAGAAAGERAPSPTGPPARRPGGFVPAGERGAALLSAPGGDTVARAATGTEMELVAREGNWARVRVEGWTWLPASDTAGSAAGVGAGPLTPADLARDPRAFRGRVVSWRLQFISLERAEKVRTDFFEGEPFLLTRFGGADGPFVYVAVPAEQVAGLEGLVPLELLQVTGRVRTGASSLTGTPIIDLVAIERVRVPR